MWGDLQELLKTLFLYGLVTGFIPITVIMLAGWAVCGFFKTLGSIWTSITRPRSSRPQLPRANTPAGALERVEMFEEGMRDE